ncbi:Zinc finger BED domain-containing protein RICESLEEPER 2 [Rhynchospora pubera]|uniref:Zinc finger BED domain-containing protein RICESLEEPER 2 n=1 Tax=Rhynchospora pubera TaxID=906938 RepID=A0AAV8GEN2_9POAL|nr:Zinc finger BED domain-containing protein RICESLEEPER 2 [Rhynchospora pubera]
MTAAMIATFNANMGLPSFDEEHHVRDKVERLFAIYAEQHNSSITSTSRASEPQEQGGMSSLLRAIHRRRPNEVGSSSSERVNDEFKKYEGYPISIEEADSLNFDLLTYWEAHEKVWPTMSCIARDILAIPVSTVPSESCFSACNRVLTDRRNKLGNKMFEALVCLKDWCDAEYRQQDKSKMYATEEENATSRLDTEGTSDDGSDFEAPEPENWWNYSQYSM